MAAPYAPCSKITVNIAGHEHTAADPLTDTAHDILTATGINWPTHQIGTTRVESPTPQPHKVAHRLSSKTLGVIVDEYLAGATGAELARSYGLSRQTVIRLVSQAGYEPRPRGPVPRHN